MFPFDDSKTSKPQRSEYPFTNQSCHSVFDEGSLKDDPEKADQELQNLLAAMATTDSEKELPRASPIVEVHNSVWFRIAKVTHLFKL